MSTLGKQYQTFSRSSITISLTLLDILNIDASLISVFLHKKDFNLLMAYFLRALLRQKPMEFQNVRTRARQRMEVGGGTSSSWSSSLIVLFWKIPMKWMTKVRVQKFMLGTLVDYSIKWVGGVSYSGYGRGVRVHFSPLIIH